MRMFDKTITNNKQTEVKNLISFGDMNKKPEKEYVITINGMISDDILIIRGRKQYTVNLTEEELKGIEKFFTALRDTKFDSITGMGVEAR